MSETSSESSRFDPAQEQFGKLIFGSPKKLAVGIWVLSQDLHKPFSLIDATEAYTGNRRQSDGQIGGYLQSFADFEMLSRLEEPESRHQRYARLEHPIWGIFDAAKVAFDALPPKRQDG